MINIYSYELWLRVVTAVLLLGRTVFWTVTEIQANKAKPKLKKATIIHRVKLWVANGLGLFILLQTFGLTLFPYKGPFLLQLFGFILVVISVIIGVLARKELGTNWVHAAEYQIKKDHDLITTGIYAYIRNPIYTGALFSQIGTQLVVQSNLFILFVTILPIAHYWQAKQEEKILSAHFGKKYQEYKQRTKMFIPYIW